MGADFESRESFDNNSSKFTTAKKVKDVVISVDDGTEILLYLYQLREEWYQFQLYGIKVWVLGSQNQAESLRISNYQEKIIWILINLSPCLPVFASSWLSALLKPDKILPYTHSFYNSQSLKTKIQQKPYI